MKIKKYFLFSLLFILFIFLLACSKVTKENYQRLQIGMSYREVVALLGKPIRKAEIIDKVQYTWQDKEKVVKIKFKDERVVSFSKKGF